MLRTSVFTAAGAVALVSLLSAGPAVAGGHGGDDGHHSSRTFSYTLPGDEVYPEGVDTHGKYFYVTSTQNGDVFRGRIKDRRSAKVFLPGGKDGRTVSVGIEATDDLLIVVGGDTGKVFVYDRDSRKLLGKHTVPGSAATFLNDLAVTRNGDVFVTDSARDVVYRIDDDDVTDRGRLHVFASFVGKDPAGQFNANGIVAADHGRSLIVVQSDTGNLFRVSTHNGKVRKIDLRGATVVGGDGLEIKDRTLWVVQGNVDGRGQITKIKLRDHVSSGRVVSETTDKTFMLPTTAALHNGRLLVVNSQFDKRPTGNPVLPFKVSSIKAP
jgi:sugar lactone lactonase YvrE